MPTSNKTYASLRKSVIDVLRDQTKNRVVKFSNAEDCVRTALDFVLRDTSTGRSKLSADDIMSIVSGKMEILQYCVSFNTPHSSEVALDAAIYLMLLDDILETLTRRAFAEVAW